MVVWGIKGVSRGSRFAATLFVVSVVFNLEYQTPRGRLLGSPRQHQKNLCFTQVFGVSYPTIIYSEVFPHSAVVSSLGVW